MTTDSIDVVFSFDTTGSMYPCLTQVRRYVAQTVETLFHDIPDLRIAIIAHGDYCDAGRTYVTSIFDFSKNIRSITDFISSVGRTDGGDFPECYELVLQEARTKLSWKSGRSKVLVMIGDATPHGPDYRLNTKRIDWRNELGLLLEANINVYGVHAMPGIRQMSRAFYKEIAEKTGGFYLTLDQFASVTDLVMSICYRQDGDESFNQFIQTVEDQGRMTRSLDRSFRIMKGEEVEDDPYEPISYSEGVSRTRRRSSDRAASTKYAFESDGLTPVPSGRFQVIPVDSEVVIKQFIGDEGIEFEKGRSFYELIKHGKKRYKVQQYKQIILLDKTSGEFFNGKEVREKLGLLPMCEIVGKNRGSVETLSPTRLKHPDVENYRVFIQSTSFTRKLVPGTHLLYEVKGWDEVDEAEAA